MWSGKSYIKRCMNLKDNGKHQMQIYVSELKKAILGQVMDKGTCFFSILDFRFYFFIFLFFYFLRVD